MFMKKVNDMAKAKVGFYGITGCAGCLLSVAFNEAELLDIVGAVDIVAFPFIKGKNSDEPLDIAFIEGVVVSNDDMDVLKKLRERAKVVVALGACACEGNIPAMRNFADEKEIDYLKYDKNYQNQDIGKPVPIHKVIQVEYFLPGCPPDREEIKKFIKDILLGKKFRNYKDPVCVECRLKDNNCLLDSNVICLGSITRGNCAAVCPNHGLKCYGCRGLTDDANFEEFFDLMEKKGFSAKDVKKIMDTFMALSVNEKLKGTKWETLH
jgi:sulfhydrogenase subunit delta